MDLPLRKNRMQMKHEKRSAQGRRYYRRSHPFSSFAGHSYHVGGDGSERPVQGHKEGFPRSATTTTRTHVTS